MPYYAVTLPNGVRFSMLPPSTDYNQAECDVYRWARRSGKTGGFKSAGLHPMNDRDLATHKAKKHYAKVKAVRELCQ
jgi:hypothetical protein